MITPDNAVHLARARRAKGGETWLPVSTAALYADLAANTLYHWADRGRIRRKGGCVDLGEVLAVRDRSRSRVPDAPLSFQTLSYVRCAANGWTSQRIADEYQVSRQAVHDAISTAMRAMGATNRPHLVALLMARGLIFPEEVRPRSTGTPITSDRQGSTVVKASEL